MHAYIEIFCPLKKKSCVSLINTTIYLNLIRKFNVGAQGRLYIESRVVTTWPRKKKQLLCINFKNLCFF